MMHSVEALRAQLAGAGIELPDKVHFSGLGSPWYVRALLAFSGWLAGLFLLGFIGLGFAELLDSEAASMVAGIVLIGAAFALLRLSPADFLEHLGLALSLAGQALCAFAIVSMFEWDHSGTWWALAGFQAALALLMPNYTHRVLSAGFAALCLAYALWSGGQPWLASPLLLAVAAALWLQEFRFGRHVRSAGAIAYGIVLALIFLLGCRSLAREILFLLGLFPDSGSWVGPWLGDLLAGLTLVTVAVVLLHRMAEGVSVTLKAAAVTGAGILAIATVEVPGLAAGVTLLLLGFAGRNRVLGGLGLVSLLFYVSAYYYQLDITLLVKSGVLLAVGVVMLAMRWWLLRVTVKQEVQ